VTAKPALVFDLDDTLYKEREYVSSCFDWVSNALNPNYSPLKTRTRLNSLYEIGNKDAIGTLCTEIGVNDIEKKALINKMREHKPTLSLSDGANYLLKWIRETHQSYSIVTNGRSITQRRKIKALALEDARSIAISEELGIAKPDRNCFDPAIKAHNTTNYFYIGDNPKHDFLGPNELGWTTVMLKDDGRNIHPQNIDVPDQFQAKYTVNCLRDLVEMLNVKDRI